MKYILWVRPKKNMGIWRRHRAYRFGLLADRALRSFLWQNRVTYDAQILREGERPQ